MGRKPVYVLAGLVLVGLTSAGCKSSSPYGGYQGPIAQVGQGSGAYNSRSSIASRGTTGTTGMTSLNSTRNAGTPTTDLNSLGAQHMPTGPATTPNTLSIQNNNVGTVAPTTNQGFTNAISASPGMGQGYAPQPSYPSQGNMGYSVATQMPVGTTTNTGTVQPTVGTTAPSSFGNVPQYPVPTSPEMAPRQ